jgi:hypothetical protein
MAGGLDISALPQLEFAKVTECKGLARPATGVTEERQ